MLNKILYTCLLVGSLGLVGCGSGSGSGSGPGTGGLVENFDNGKVIGTTWELVEVFQQDSHWLKEGSITPASELSETYEVHYEGKVYTAHRFKTMTFIDGSRIDINNGRFLSEYFFSGLDLLATTEDTRADDNKKYYTDMGAISINGSIMTLRSEINFDHIIDGQKKNINQIRIKTYRQIR